MAFRFRLQSLLSLSRAYEREEERRLKQIGAQLGAARASAAALEAARQRDGRHFLQQLVENSTVAGSLSMRVVEISWYERRAAEIGSEVDRLQQQFEAQLRKFEDAKARRESLETLRDRQRAAWEQEQSRRLQNAVDDLVLMRRRIHERG